MMDPIVSYIAAHGIVEGYLLVIPTFAPLLFAAVWYAFRFLLYLDRRCARMLFHDPVPMRCFTGFALLTLLIGMAMINAPASDSDAPMLFLIAFAIAPIWLLMMLSDYSNRVMLSATFFDTQATVMWPDSMIENL
jgi:hypothetical protein